MTPAEYLKRPYGPVIPEGDGTFRGEIIEFPGCIATGGTAAQALANLEDVAASWLEAVLSKGQRVPDPVENIGFSGKLVLRLPKSLHRKAAHLAAKEGVSFNQFIVSSVAEQAGAWSASRRLPINVSGVNFYCGSGNLQLCGGGNLMQLGGGNLLQHWVFTAGASIGGMFVAGTDVGGTGVSGTVLAGTTFVGSITPPGLRHSPSQRRTSPYEAPISWSHQMPEVNQYLFTNKELLDLLIKQAGVHEGRWMLAIISAGNFGPSNEQMSPGAAVLINQVGIQRALPEAPEALSVDAAVVNPATPQIKRRKV